MSVNGLISHWHKVLLRKQSFCANDDTDRVRLHLSVRTDIEETAGCVIGAGAEGVSTGEILNGVDIGVVSSECLHTFLLADIPEFGEGVAGTGDELVGVEGVDAQAHDIAQMVGKFVYF